MPPPKKEKRVHAPPIFTEFKPSGYPNRLLKKTSLSIDEFESIRLADSLGLTHEEAAVEMGMSRSTFSRLIERSRKKYANLLVHGHAMIISGGPIHFSNNIYRCLECEQLFRTDLQTNIKECPECSSSNLLNLASGFGHGRCCIPDNQK